MSITPTNYDLQQDQEIEGLKEIVTTTYQPPGDMEESFPIVDEPMNDEQWAHLAKAYGSGVISYGGAPYRYSNVDDVNNTMIIHAADDEGRESGAVLEGFAHRMMDNVTVKVPAVSVATDYVIGLQYDPLRERNPIKLGCFERPLDVTQGKKYIPIWEGRRNPSTVLSSVTWNTARSRISPTTTVARERYLPDPRHSGLMWGTICYTYRDREWFQLQWATEEGGEMVWVRLGGAQQSYTRPDGVYKWVGHGAKPGADRIGDVVYLAGRLDRGSSFEGRNFNAGTDYELMTLPEGMRPKSERRFIAKASGFVDADATATIRIYADGRVIATPHRELSWLGLDDISYVLTR